MRGMASEEVLRDLISSATRVLEAYVDLWKVWGAQGIVMDPASKGGKFIGGYSHDTEVAARSFLARQWQLNKDTVISSRSEPSGGRDNIKLTG